MALNSDVDQDTQQHLEQQEQEEKQQQQQQQQQQQKSSFHVLAVDDSMIDRILLEKLLKVSSYQVTCVDSGDKALEYLGLLDNLETPPDSISSSSPPPPPPPPQPSQVKEGSKVNLIMTDFCMPGMSGYDLLKRVKGSTWKDVPVVVMSSENVPSRISMCLEEGAEEFLLKPLQPADMQKLQPYLLKSLNNHSCTDKDKKLTAHKDLITEDNIENKDSNNNNNNNNNNECNNFKTNNIFSKRKVLSGETPERMPKMKELAVV